MRLRNRHQQPAIVCTKIKRRKDRLGAVRRPASRVTGRSRLPAAAACIVAPIAARTPCRSRSAGTEAWHLAWLDRWTEISEHVGLARHTGLALLLAPAPALGILPVGLPCLTARLAICLDGRNRLFGKGGRSTIPGGNSVPRRNAMTGRSSATSSALPLCSFPVFACRMLRKRRFGNISRCCGHRIPGGFRLALSLTPLAPLAGRHIVRRCTAIGSLAHA